MGEWISVLDELPSNARTVIIYQGFGSGLMFMGWYANCWTTDDDEPISDVTHWMEQPKHPHKNKDS